MLVGLAILAQSPSTLGQLTLPALEVRQTDDKEENDNLSHMLHTPKGRFPLWGHSPDSSQKVMTQSMSSALRLGSGASVAPDPRPCAPVEAQTASLIPGSTGRNSTEGSRPQSLDQTQLDEDAKLIVAEHASQDGHPWRAALAFLLQA